MSTFIALNVEPESDIEESVLDDSKEIQVEEALKLYQQALKLHSQGPAFYEEAEEAYDALFASEVFRYPEALTQAKRLAQVTETDDSEDDELVQDGDIIPGSAEAAPNSLPQILYLANKNHGQFLVDRIAHLICAELQKNPGYVFEYDGDAREAVRESLAYFADALDGDEADADLWRRVSRIARLLGSRRVSRYCLESALGIESPDSLIGTIDLEGTFATAELRSLIAELNDDVSKLENMSVLKHGKGLYSSLKALMDPFPRLPLPLTDVRPSYLPMPGQIKAISAPQRSWASIGQSLLAKKKSDTRDASTMPFGQGYCISIPNPRHSVGDTLELSTPRRLLAAESLFKRRETQDSGSLEKEALQSDEVLVDQEVLVDSPPVERSQTVNFDIGTENDKETGTSLPKSEENQRQQPLKDEGVANKSAPQSPNTRRESSSRSSLKRNSDAAGLPDGSESARSRSKRLRSRVSEPIPTTEEEVDPTLLHKQYLEQLEPNMRADEWLFGVVHRMVSIMDVHNFATMGGLRDLLWPAQDDSEISTSSEPLANALKDLKTALSTWDLNKSNLLLHGSGSGASVTLIDNADDSGLASFLEHSKPAGKNLPERDVLLGQGLDRFIDQANNGWRDMEELGTLWIEHLLKPEIGSSAITDVVSRDQSRYIQSIWPTTLKETVAKFLVEEDNSLFATYQSQLTSMSQEDVNAGSEYTDAQLNARLIARMYLVQSLFELHLDIFGRMTNASSKVDQPTRTAQKDRMHRWASLVSQTIGRHVTLEKDSPVPLILSYRYLWATVIYVSLNDPSSREHVLLCLRDLKRDLSRSGVSMMLPNNTIMPEISAEAAEREIARLTTMDFFLQIFDPSSEDPLAVIESLEPILISIDPTSTESANKDERIIPDSQDLTEAQNAMLEVSNNVEGVSDNSQHQHMSDFLRKASASLRLSLWRRLKTAYEKIEYAPMVLVCNFRSIDIILHELKGGRYSKEPIEDRTANLMVWVRNLSDLLISCQDMLRTKVDVLDCMDEMNLSIALSTCADLIKIFHVFALWEDSVRIGESQTPVQASGAVTPHKSAMTQLREMQPRCWMLQFQLLKEMTAQNADLFEAANEDLAEFLMAVHNTFGRREYCRLGKKAFLKSMKTELIQLKPSGDWELELAQIFYDLYGLKICSTNMVLEEHGCDKGTMDRNSALELIEPLMAQAMRMNIKDVLRSDVKVACDDMQFVIGQPRTHTIAHNFNRRMILAHLKAPINPMNLYRAVKGIGGLSGREIRTEYSTVANKHWYFLQGHLLLAKYRSRPRTTPDSGEDLDKAITYFKLDLDFDSEQWESWYRLAQTYDAQIEEEVTWSADKINDETSELITLQKSSINCYTMAIATAIRTAEDTALTTAKISDLYTDFGNRIYASTRAPYDMKVFSLKDVERFCNTDTKGTYKREPFKQMTKNAAWYFASELFRRALVSKPNDWISWYMLGKCYWKLYRRPGTHAIAFQDAIDSFVRSVECVPEKRDSRHSDKDPVLEPHYKLVSVVHKLVRARALSDTEGVKTLSASTHARKIARADFDDWDKYLLRVIKSLRSADKANWHHRMVARAAHIIYNADSTDLANSLAAKQELASQIFTKTMTIQVWRPENERAGRHFVYTTRYTLFYGQLLAQLGDKVSLETLCKRIRRKQSDFIDHAQVWTELCASYVKLIRAQGKIPQGAEDAVFKAQIPFEIFTVNADLLETWGQSQLSLGHALMDKLREIIELKKLNGNYMKAAMIDDLVIDTYLTIYDEVVPGLVAKAGEAENRDRMRIDRMLMNDSPAPEPEQETDSAQPTAATRTKTIGRTELRKRAEALVSKLMQPKEHWRTKAAKEAKELAAQREIPADDGGAKSAPASVHDSADDESELSEVEESDEEEARPMFPGLAVKAEVEEQIDEEAEQGDVDMIVDAEDQEGFETALEDKEGDDEQEETGAA